MLSLLGGTDAQHRLSQHVASVGSKTSITIPLTCPDLEKASGVEDLLDCFHGKDTMSVLCDYGRAKRLISLLDKYDCPMYIDMVKKYIHLALLSRKEGWFPTPTFRLCAQLDDPGSCKDAIIWGGSRTWNEATTSNAPPDTATVRHNLVGYNCLDIASTSESMLADIPIRYIAALARGLTKRGDRGTAGAKAGGDWKAVAEEFYRVATRSVLTGPDDSQQLSTG